MRPRTGLPQVEDRAREARIVSTVTSAVLTILHPRTSFSVNIQEMQDDGCLESACVNASCLALLDASVSLKFLIASVSEQQPISNQYYDHYDQSEAHWIFTGFSLVRTNNAVFSLVQVTVIVMKDTGDIVTDPSLKQTRAGSSALLTFVFSNRQGCYFCRQKQ